MRMDHAALYVRDLEAAKAFYERYFGACAGRQNIRILRTGLSTYFLSFEGEGRLEIMQRPGLAPRPERQAAEGVRTHRLQPRLSGGRRRAHRAAAHGRPCG